MRFEIDDLAAAAAAIEYFNAFHDGFIQELTIRSDDRFGAEGEQYSGGSFALEVVFAHYNYGDGRPPHDQLIHARFEGVREVAASFSGTAFEWSINHVDVSASSRPTDDFRTESCMRLAVWQQRLEGRTRWFDHEDFSFTFARAVIEEDEEPR